MSKCFAMLAVIAFAFPALGAPSVKEKPAEKELVKGVNPKCGMPPEVPGARDKSCVYDTSTGVAVCMYDVGAVDDAAGIKWRLFMYAAQAQCGGRWAPMKLEGQPYPNQLLPEAKSI